MSAPRAVGWRAVVIAVFAIGIASTGLWILANGDVADAGDANTIDSCTEIGEPGRYSLAGDLLDDASTCVEITAGDVVLDGRGHRIEGDGSFGTAGVVARSPSDRPIANVTVRNVTVSDWDDGIRFVGVEDGVVAGTTTTENRVGLSLLNARGVRVVDNDARSNRIRGISLLEDAANNVLENNTATDNDLYGIHLAEAGVTNNTLSANDASGNEFGIVLVEARDNALVDNTARSNRIAGIWLSAARDNLIDGNLVSNRFYGVYLADRSDGNVISNTTAEDNPVGIRLRASDRNVVRNNEIRSSTDTPILLISSDDNEVVGNVGSDNARGVIAVRSANNTIEDNDVE